MGDDGKTKFYSFIERANPSRIAALEADITALPKAMLVFETCNFWKGQAKLAQIAKTGLAIDVAVTNYDYSDNGTIACVLKHMYKNKVGTQLIFGKSGQDGMYYSVYVTNKDPL